MIVKRVKNLAKIFNIDVCAYAIMNNHYHLVLKINSTENWNEKQVLAYWSELCLPKLICQKFLKNEPQSKADVLMVLMNNRFEDYSKFWVDLFHILDDHLA